MTQTEKALFEAIANGKVDVVAQMLNADKKLLSAVDDEIEGSPKWDCPIHRACRIGNVDVVNSILDVSQDEKDRPKIVEGVQTASPLLLSIVKKHRLLVERLLALGANTNHANNKDNGYTAIFYAIGLDDPDLVQALVTAGANLSYKASNGAEPIRYASERENDQIVTILKKARLKELENRQKELEARNKVLQSEISVAKAQHAQDQLKLNSEFAQYSLDVYKSVVVEDNKGPLPKFVPSSVASSKTNQAYADAQQKQAAPSGQPPALATTPAKKPN